MLLDNWTHLTRSFGLQYEAKENLKITSIISTDENFAQIKSRRGPQVKQRRQFERRRQQDDVDVIIVERRRRPSAKQHDPLQREDQPQQDGQPVEVEHLIEHEVAAQN